MKIPGGDVSFWEEDVPSHIKQEVQNNSEYQKKLQYVITKAYDRGSYKVNFISDGTRPSYDEPSIDETLYHQTFAFEAGDMFYAIHGINGRLLIDAVYCGNGLFDVWVAIQDFYDFAYMTDLYNCLSSYGKVSVCALNDIGATFQTLGIGRDYTVTLGFSYLYQDPNYSVNSGSGTTSGNSTGSTFDSSTQGGSSGTTYVENQYYRNPQATFTEGYYTGEWSNGAPNGYGKIVFSDVNGDGKRYSIATNTTTYYALSYEGNFSNGFRYGQGTTYYEGGYRDEGTYYGAWEANKVVFEGNRWLNNDLYNGYWPSWTIIAANTTTSKSETHGDWVSVSNKATYTVTYNANGGSGAPQSQIKTAGTPLTLSNSKPAREGYTFLGWATNSSASGASYRPGDSFLIDANTTLYAVWELKYVVPPTPTLNATSKSVSLAWTQEDSDGYYLWRHDWSLPYEQASKRLNNGNPVYSSYVDSEIVQGREYSYQLQSVRIAKEREYDGYGNSVSVTIPLASEALEKSIPSSWAQDSIIKAYDMGLIPEYMLADYSHTTTRIDFVRLAFNAIEQHSGWMQQVLYDNGLVDSIELGPSLVFDDVSFNCGYDEYDGYRVAALNALGIVLGVGNDKFEPYREITREEAAVLLSRVHSFLRWGEVRSYSYKNSTTNLYADNDSISSWAVYDVYNMKAIDVMNGIGNNRFSPKGTYTIEQSIVTFVRLLDK